MRLLSGSMVCRRTLCGVVLLAFVTSPMLGQRLPAITLDSPQSGVLKRAAHVRPVQPGPVPAVPVAVAPMTPEQLPAEPPRVTFENGLLTIDSQNSTLAAVLNAVGYQMAAQIEVPPGTANERVAVHLSGAPRETIAAMLEGSGLNYVIMGSPANPDIVQTVILTRMVPATGAREQQAVIASVPVTPQPVPAMSASPPTPISAAQALPLPVAPVVEEPQIQPPAGIPAAANPAMGGGRQDMDCADLGLPPNCHQN